MKRCRFAITTAGICALFFGTDALAQLLPGPLCSLLFFVAAYLFAYAQFMIYHTSGRRLSWCFVTGAVLPGVVICAVQQEYQLLLPLGVALVAGYCAHDLYASGDTGVTILALIMLLMLTFWLAMGSGW